MLHTLGYIYENKIEIVCIWAKFRVAKFPGGTFPAAIMLL